MDKSADAIVKEITGIVDNGEYFWDLCSSVKYFADTIDVENPRLSLSEYVGILHKFSNLIRISFILNMNYKPFIESYNEFAAGNPKVDMNKIYDETIKAIDDKLMEIQIRFDEYCDEYYNENSGSDIIDKPEYSNFSEKLVDEIIDAATGIGVNLSAVDVTNIAIYTLHSIITSNSGIEKKKRFKINGVGGGLNG